MIGKMTFWNGREQCTAVLSDDLEWRCDCADSGEQLNRLFPPRRVDDVPDVVIGRHMLYQAADRMSGHVETTPSLVSA